MVPGKLSNKEWELLSSYLDGELSPREKARVEARLRTQPEFKDALDGLRRTKSILLKAQVRKVPHNFTVTHADVQRVSAPRWLPTMQWSSAVTALVAVFLFAYQLIPGLTYSAKIADQRNALTSESAPAASNQPLAATDLASATPEVIYWGGPPSPAFGLGGGGGGGGGGAAAIGGGAGPVSSTNTNPFPQPPIPNSRPDLQVQPTATPPSALNAEPVTGTGPILGVRPKDLQGYTLGDSSAAIAEETLPDQAKQSADRTWLWFTAGGLLAAAAGLFITSIIVKRNTSG